MSRPTMIAFESLNRNQRRAAAWNGGPALVLAGPGSGKTAVLTLRVARLLEEDESAAVLALTFTDKAAAEMREREGQVLREHTDRARLCTFHEFAVDIVGQHGSHLGIRPDFQLFTQDEDRVAVLEEVLRNRFGGGPGMPSDRTNLLHLVDRLFSESYGGGGPSSSLASTPEWLPSLFNRYCDALVAANRLDFGSVLHFANRLLVEKPAVARVVRLAWSHICVDGLQNTNRAQYDLLRLVAPDRHHNLFVVADDDPVAYPWKGASPKRLRDLRSDYDVNTIRLPESHRCPPEILDHSNRLIAPGPRLIDGETTVSGREPRPASERIVRHEVYPTHRSEAECIGHDIRARDLSPADCVVLARTNLLVLRAAAGLRSVGHEVSVPANRRDFDAPVLGVLAEALRLANSRHDRVVLRRICREWERLTGVVIEPHAVGAAAALVGGDFLRAWVDVAEANAGEAGNVLQCIRTDLVDRLDFWSAVDWFLDEGWWSLRPREPDLLTWEEVRTWRDLHRDIVAKRGSGIALNTYLRHSDGSPKTPPPGPEAVRCMTLRRARGTEFRHVYLIGMAQEVFPSQRALRQGAGSGGVEEERRSCFVAMTRARETLTLTRARQPPGTTYQLRVALRGAKPPVWRRLLVSPSMRLSRLHDALQLVMGWDDCHLHMFVKADRRFTLPNPWQDDVGPDGRPGFLDGRKYRIDQLLTRAKDWIEYQYDFGDKWHHRITLQKILLRDPSVRLPVCLSGRGRCPPEDSGGVWRFRHMLTILANPDHEEYEQVAEWIDPDFDPDAFSVEAVNTALRGTFG